MESIEVISNNDCIINISLLLVITYKLLMFNYILI